MRVLFFTTYSDLYGANRSLLSIMKALKEDGSEVLLCIPKRGQMTEKMELLELPFCVLPFYSGFLYLKPQIKHLLVPFLAIWNLFIFPFIIFRGIKFNPDLVYSNSSLENLGIFVAKLFHRKHILHVREFMSKDYNSYFVFGSFLRRKFIGLSDGVIFVSNSVRDYIMKGFPFKIKNKVIYNGISFPSNSKMPIRKTNFGKEINLGLIGIFDKAKGQIVAVDFFANLLQELPQAKLHLFGEKKCSYKGQLLKEISSRGLKDKVMLHGFVNDTGSMFNMIDFCVVFSRSEGFGRVTVEAMAHGVPVVGFDAAGTSELIKDRVTGCLFRDYRSFEESINYLIQTPDIYNRISSNAYNDARLRFNEGEYVANVLAFIKDILLS